MKKKPSEKVSDEEKALFLRAFYGESVELVVKEEIEFAKMVDRITDHEMATALKEKRAGDRKEGRKKIGTSQASALVKIDLHGFTREMARKRLMASLERCVQLNKRRLIIIHGKGSGALKEEVEAFLRGHPEVESFKMAPPKEGGSGAVEVLLKAKKYPHMR